ncbi:UMP phosphatase, partial [Escherichia coli]|nr:UMP phosphatase [Escherichia coli]
VLVLYGVSTLSDIETMPFRPSYVYPSVADITIF